MRNLGTAHAATLALSLTALVVAGCVTQPDFTGYAVNTPNYYRENKAFSGMS